MDIKHLKYFIVIVDSNFNLSAASKKLYLSQPTLSQFLINFENKHNMKLFYRSNSKLISLTEQGNILYRRAIIITNEYKKMIDELKISIYQKHGSVKIGIPSFVLPIIFHDILPKLITEYPSVNFEIIERNSQELAELFIQKKVDLVILVEPIKFNNLDVDKILIKKEELVIFMKNDNPLNIKRKKLHWSEIAKQKIALPKWSSSINQLVLDKFNQLSLPIDNITIQIDSWDFLVMSTLSSNFITILPSLTMDQIKNETICFKRVYSPIYWNLVICREKNNKESIHNVVFFDIVKKLNYKFQ